MANSLRELPAVNAVLDSPPLSDLDGRYSHDRIVAAVREELTLARQQLDGRESSAPSAADVAEKAAGRLEREHRPRFRRVINATGIVLHTNLGRAPMAEEAARAAYEASRRYLNLEMDLDTGERSSRQGALRHWLCRLTGAESATAVNNCAAATVIALRALAAGKEVVISRGQRS